MSNSQESQRAEEECNFPAKALSTFRGSQRPLSAAGNCLLSSITAHTHMEGHFPQDSELQLNVGLFIITVSSAPTQCIIEQFTMERTKPLCEQSLAFIMEGNVVTNKYSSLAHFVHCHEKVI